MKLTPQHHGLCRWATNAECTCGLGSAIASLRIANRNLSDTPLLNLSVAVALHSLTGQKPKRSRRTKGRR